MNAAAPHHVLLVEDHAQLRRILETSLLAAGFRVTAAPSGDEALQLLESGLNADLLFSDVRMPGSLDGRDLARWVRERRPAMAILLQTGFSNVDVGDFRVLRKPFNPQELLQQIQEALAAAGL